ncbi:MAG: hypothetical protein JJ992_17490, partial [Planctomycetes bacterium]|nr:hypothetical protein [Planctomycetota bacterium]
SCRRAPGTRCGHRRGVRRFDKHPISPNPGEGTSPYGGYTTDTLDRVTGGAIGPSGAIVILNNWKKPGPRPVYYNTSTGGNSFVIVPGAATPVKTPLIGPPRSFGERHR